MDRAQAELVKVSGAGSEPVTLTDAKLFLRLDTTDEDALVGSLVTAARIYAEKFCRRSFLVGDQYLLSLDHFPLSLLSGASSLNQPLDELFESEQLYLSSQDFLSRIAIELPLDPVTAVTAITYKDTAGASQTLDPSLYTLVQDDDANPRIYPAYGTGWPATQIYPQSVQVAFTSGGTPDETVNLAIKQLVAHWYVNREAVVMQSGVTPQQVPFAAEMLLWPSRILEF